jgi:hypothetical protein
MQAARTVAGREHERDVASAQFARHGIAGLAVEVHVEYGTIDRLRGSEIGCFGDARKRAEEDQVVLRHYAETRYGAKSWKCQRRVVARIEASIMGMDIRYVVTSLAEGSAERIYDTLYCARGQAENLIKMHKSQLASDRTSCRSANANQMRLILHTAAFWLMWRIQQTIPKSTALAAAELATLRLRLLKVAARVIETATRIRVAFASACPDAAVSRTIANAFKPAPT